MLSMSAATLARQALVADLDVTNWFIDHAKDMKHRAVENENLDKEFLWHKKLSKLKAKRSKIEAALKQLKHEGKNNELPLYFYNGTTYLDITGPG